ncbi:MAG: hypothetical protein COB93_09250 [Sneathiella sp.]|nr:MAG: hypothetical protein COB93_09250 [Sneathiella sp.]
MTGSLASLALAMLIFLAIHIIPSSFLRTKIVGRIGEGGYMAFFNLLSLVVFVWLIFAYQAAPVGESLWDAGNAGRYIGVVLMVIASVFFVGIFTGPNPTASGAGKLVDKEIAYTGINSITRHPMMWAITLWALVHIINNGDAGSVIFFGGLGFLAFAGTFLIDAKKQRQLADGWTRYAARTSNIPFLAMAQGRATVSLKTLWWRVVLGLILFFVFFGFHSTVIGVSPGPI